MKPITEKFVKQSVIQWLYRNGWGRNLRAGELRDKGVDIKVRHNNYSRYFLIETKGEGSAKSKSRNSQKETHFVYGLGQIVTRMKSVHAGYYYGLGLPDSIAKIAVRRIPKEVAKDLRLYIFSVNKDGRVKRFSWKQFSKGKN